MRARASLAFEALRRPGSGRAAAERRGWVAPGMGA
jgi:hypothetical protein